MSTLALIARSSKKKGAVLRASELYQGELFKKSLALAKALDQVPFILSAKHELLHPDAEIGPYDLRLHSFTREHRRLWAHRIAAQLELVMLASRRTFFETELVFYAGATYCDPLAYHLANVWSYRRIRLPLKGMSIGQQLAWLKREVSR